MVLALWALDSAIRSVAPHARLGWFTLTIMLTLVAQFTKEIAVTMPAIYLGLELSRPILSSVKSTLRHFIGLSLLICFGLAGRSLFINTFGGAYGNYFDLLRSTNVLQNFGSFFGSFVRIPLNQALPNFFLVNRLEQVSVIVLFAGAFRFPRRAMAVFTAFVLCLAPVLWFQLQARTTDGGRVMYSPGLLTGALLAMWFETPRANVTATKLLNASDIIITLALFGLLGSGVISNRYQLSIWRKATELSRSVLRQVEPRLSEHALFLTNMPSKFDEGPYILKSYAFQFYFEGQHIPVIRANDVAMRFNGGAISAGPLEQDEPGHGTPGEVRVVLNLSTL